MIKTAIAGGSDPRAGELIRILVNHPDVDLRCVADSAVRGKKIQAVHHGLIGDIDLEFSDSVDPDSVDLLIVASGCIPADVPEKLRLIDMRPGIAADRPDDTVYGLSEIYRKPLVRGATRAAVPSPAASAALIALYPVAAHLMLSGPVALAVEAPGDLVATAADGVAREVEEVLQSVQQSFYAGVSVKVKPSPERRAMKVTTSLPLALDADQVEALYEGIYDDHRFTHLLRRQVGGREVAGTQKCLVSYRADGSMLSLTALVDPYMRGGAGEAVHLLNLLFGLHECTGLRLKSTEF